MPFSFSTSSQSGLLEEGRFLMPPLYSPIALPCPAKPCAARILSRPLVPDKGPPGGLADVGRLDPQPLLEAAVARYRGEDAAVVVVGRIEDDPPVRGEARRFVPDSVGEGLDLPALE